MITPIIPIMKGKYGNMGWMVHWRGEVIIISHYSTEWPCSSPGPRTPPWWSGSRGTRTRHRWCRSAWRTCCSAYKCYSIFNSVSQSLHWYFQEASIFYYESGKPYIINYVHVFMKSHFYSLTRNSTVRYNIRAAAEAEQGAAQIRKMGSV